VRRGVSRLISGAPKLVQPIGILERRTFGKKQQQPFSDLPAEDSDP